MTITIGVALCYDMMIRLLHVDMRIIIYYLDLGFLAFLCKPILII